MDRRLFLKLSGAALLSTKISEEANAGLFFGWKREAPNQKVSLWSRDAKLLRGTGEGKVALLWTAIEKVTRRRFKPHQQGVSDCCGHSVALAIDLLSALQALDPKRQEQWQTFTAPEPIFAGSRIEIGGTMIELGSRNTWCMRWCQEVGVLLQKEYGEYDLSTYNPMLSETWGDVNNHWNDEGGVPDFLETFANLHKLQTYSRVGSWEEVRDSIVNGYPVVIGSAVGFDSMDRHRKKPEPYIRDARGFLPRTTNPDKIWRHSMTIIGVDDRSNRPGALFMNSWGSKWVIGPTRHFQPPGSFWVDAETVTEMLAYESSFSLSSHNGYKRQKIDYRIY